MATALLVVAMVLVMVLLATAAAVYRSGEQRRLAILAEQLRTQARIDAITAATITRMREAALSRSDAPQ